MKREIVILAKSIKNQNFCIAGKDVETNEWIRPVATLDGGALSEKQSVAHFYSKGRWHGYPCKLMQKIEIEFEKHVPLYFQIENYLISDTPWRQKFRIKNEEVFSYLRGALDHPASIWDEGSSLSAELLRTGVKEANIQGIESLYLIEASQVQLYYSTQGNKRKRRVMFDYNNIHYNLPCTDPRFDYIEKNTIFSSAILCVSLGEEFQDGYHYKIVASIYVKG